MFSLNRFTKLGRTYRSMQRYREITGVLLKHGFGEFVTALQLHRHLRLGSLQRKRAPAAPTLSRYERVRLALAELGPTFVKLGQMLSTRRDLLPAELITELAYLQDQAPPMPLADVQQILTEEFGARREELFAAISPEPIASASIAQVHAATTRDGQEIVLKIRRPRIRAQIETDLEILHHLAELFERFIEGAAVFDPVHLVEEFARSIRKELDLSLEGARMVRMSRCFANSTQLHVPEVYREFSTEAILAMEYVHGVKVAPIERLADLALDRQVIATRGANLFMEQVFTHGFFHADPHPGNLLILPGNVICLLDYGCMGILSDRSREQLSNVIIGFVERDERRIAAAVFQMSGYRNYDSAEQVETDIAIFIEDQLYRPLGEIQVGALLAELSRILHRHDIRLPANFFLLIKSVTSLEGTARILAPNFDLLTCAQPFARQLLRQQINLRKMAKDLIWTASEFRNLMRDLPFEIRQILTQFKHGDIGFKFEHRGLETMKQTHDQVSNRLVYGIVLAALIVGSSIMVLSRIPPKWHEIPILGLVGFVASGLMGFWLLYSILKHGKM